MYKFLRSVTTMTGKRFAAGSVVPDGVFGCLPEMVRAGDIAEVVEPKPEIVEGAEPEPAEDTEAIDDASAKRAELARKARERRAAKRTDK